MRNLIICFQAQDLNPAKPQSLRHGHVPKRVVRPASHEWPEDWARLTTVCAAAHRVGGTD